MEGIMPFLVEGERTMNTVAGFGMKKAKYTHSAMSICGEEVHKTNTSSCSSSLLPLRF